MNFFNRKEDQEKQIGQLRKELDKAQTRLKQLSDLKLNFVSVISHELRTPLTSIKEGVALLADGALGELTPKQLEFLNIVRRNTDRLTRLVNDLLDLSQLENGGIRFRKESVNIEALLGEVEISMAPLFERKKMQLKTRFSGDLPAVYADTHRVKRVLGHLLENALKFTSGSGDVILEAALCSPGDWGVWKESQYVRISVRDHGMGIPRDQMRKLFNRFEQINREAGPGAKGTGLGLVICREIVERHGGKIWTECPKGGGTVFSFTLPVYHENLELSSIFEECKLEAALEHDPVLLMIFPLRGLTSQRELNSDQIEELRVFIKNQIRSGDRLLYHRQENAFYLFVISERPAELSLLNRIQKVIKNYLPDRSLAWSFYPEDGDNICHLKEKAFQRAEAA